MKRKIIIGAFLLLIVITAIVFIVWAIQSYSYDMQYHSDDKLVGFDAVVTLIVGGFVIFYELDLFYTVYYFFIKPKTTAKSILNILSNVSLLLIFFGDYIAHILYIHFNIFKEDWLFPIILFLVYAVLRIVCAVIPVRQSAKRN